MSMAAATQSPEAPWEPAHTFAIASVTKECNHMNMAPHTDWIEKVTYDELSVGQSARLLRTLTQDDIQAFAAVSGDTNPAHLNPEYANDTLFHGVIAHGMWGGARISALLARSFRAPAPFIWSRCCISPSRCALATRSP